MPLNPPTRSAPGFQSVTPVLLSSACNVIAGSEATANSENLSYPFRKAVIIEEIRWDLKVTVIGGLNPNLGALVATKLQLGQLYLMRDPVPIWSLATLVSVEQEQFNEFASGVSTAYSHYRWRLPKPLYVEAGQVLRSVFSRGNDGYGTINVQVTYLGKTVAPNQPRPGVIAVPYAAPFVTVAGAVYAQSNEYHLFNPFDFDLHIQRLTGRLLDITGGAPSLAQMLGSTTPNTAQTAPTIQMADSWGGKMVNDFTGIGDVFDLSRTAWTVDTVLPPKGVYTVQVWNLNTGRPAQAYFAMIGTRDERLP